MSAQVVARATARPTCDALLAAIGRYGPPEQILTDNGKVFTGRYGPGTGQVLFDRICHERGIKHLLTAPRSPPRRARSSGGTRRCAGSSSTARPSRQSRMRRRSWTTGLGGVAPGRRCARDGRAGRRADQLARRRDDWGGYSGYVADLDGHLWEIAHNPFVPLADSGQMLLPDD